MKLFVTCVFAAGLIIAFVSTPNASAGTLPSAPSADSPRGDWAVPPTAEARQELFINSLQQFLTAHPGLSEAKTRILESAIANAESSFFADDPDSEAKAKLGFTLLTLRNSLSAGQFREVLTGFQGLHTWLVENKLVSDGDCNCSGTCASGFSCQSTGCFSPKGTVNYGVCS